MKVEFTAEVEVPDGTPLDDVEKWLAFELGQSSYLNGQNAMVHTDLTTQGVTRLYVREQWR
jgi:hypothetical protein